MAIFNVRDERYGAVGNGREDDTEAIQQAVEACNTAGGGIIYYPTSTYAISRTIRCWGNVPIFHLGQGESTTIKSVPENSPSLSSCPPRLNMFAVGYGEGAHVFANMTIDGNKEYFMPPARGENNHDDNGNGIFFIARTDNRGNAVRNVRFINHYCCGVRGIGEYNEHHRDSKATFEITINGCSFSSIGRRAVFLADLTSGGVRNCDIDFTPGSQAAITILACKDFTIAQNRIANGCIGIAVASSDNYSIIDNLVRDTDGTGVVVSGGLGLRPFVNTETNRKEAQMSRRFICTGNQVYNAGGMGITVDPAWSYETEQDEIIRNTTPIEQWGIIANNLVHRTGNNGIGVNWGSCMLIQGNMVICAGIYGIGVNNSSYCTIVGNHIDHARFMGIGINMETWIEKRDAWLFGHHYIGDDNVVVTPVTDDIQQPRS